MAGSCVPLLCVATALLALALVHLLGDSGVLGAFLAALALSVTLPDELREPRAGRGRNARTGRRWRYRGHCREASAAEDAPRCQRLRAGGGLPDELLTAAGTASSRCGSPDCSGTRNYRCRAVRSGSLDLGTESVGCH